MWFHRERIGRQQAACQLKLCRLDKIAFCKDFPQMEGAGDRHDQAAGEVELKD
jgi:hypothetical protein